MREILFDCSQCGEGLSLIPLCDTGGDWRGGCTTCPYCEIGLTVVAYQNMLEALTVLPDQIIEMLVFHSEG